MDSIKPWGRGQRTSEAPQPGPERVEADHGTSNMYGISAKLYPADCPPLVMQWFHAVDIAKRKPRLGRPRGEKATSDEGKPPGQPKTFVAFAESDSRRIEAAYQRLVEEAERRRANGPHKRKHSLASPASEGAHNRVPVHEDFLFDVDIAERELSPAYWLGPVYEVRRGTWFYQDGSGLKPCEEKLAAQLEEGFLKVKAWLIPRLGSRSRSVSPSKENVRAAAKAALESRKLHQYRLLGPYMNSIATYEDGNTVWVSTDSMFSWVASTVYQRFSSGAHRGGVKLVRGYAGLSSASSSEGRRHERRDGGNSFSTEQRERQLQAQLSSSFSREAGKRDEEIREREEEEIRDDYSGHYGENQGREIDHLVLVTHGIGQLLGLRLESVKFVHAVNVMRKTMKTVYADSTPLKSLNGDADRGPGNCRVQVLPVCWRHLLDFPRQREMGGEEHQDEYPSLDDITIQGVAFARSLVSDLALDVLLYQSGYREQIMVIVAQELRRILYLFRRRNPDFKGKVHLMGHSLGSAILFDLLCRQKEESKPAQTRGNPFGFWSANSANWAMETDGGNKGDKWAFGFEVDDFYCLGSPIGLFQMLKGRTISGRKSANTVTTLASSLVPDSPYSPPDSPPDSPGDGKFMSGVASLTSSKSSPKVQQLFNIFHMSDPISYRIEPLVSPAMSSLKPQLLPCIKKGIFRGVAPQGLSNISAKVGQSVSGLWSSLSGGIASSLLNRSLGLDSEEVAAQVAAQGVTTPQSQFTQAQSSDSGLIDDDLETLYSKFQARHRALESDSLACDDNDEEQAIKLRREEAKIKALNRNGRIDYRIQESVLDYNPITTVASHMSYWADEDVSHFVLSQLLAAKPQQPAPGVGAKAIE